MPTVADFLVRALLDQDLRTLYCLPGIQLDPFFNAVFDAGGALRPVHTRHEQAAAYMALGAALATGRPSAYAVVPGPGVLNTTAALATCSFCRIGPASTGSRPSMPASPSVAIT